MIDARYGNDVEFVTAILSRMDTSSIKCSYEPAIDITAISGLTLGGISISLLADGMYDKERCIALIDNANHQS